MHDGRLRELAEVCSGRAVPVEQICALQKHHALACRQVPFLVEDETR